MGAGARHHAGRAHRGPAQPRGRLPAANPERRAAQEHPMTTAVLAARPPHRRRLRLVAHQIWYEQLSFWRNPQSAIFTFVFPVLFVTIMGALFGSAGPSSYFGGLSAMQ